MAISVCCECAAGGHCCEGEGVMAMVAVAVVVIRLECVLAQHTKIIDIRMAIAGLFPVAYIARLLAIICIESLCFDMYVQRRYEHTTGK